MDHRPRGFGHHRSLGSHAEPARPLPVPHDRPGGGQRHGSLEPGLPRDDGRHRGNPGRHLDGRRRLRLLGPEDHPDPGDPEGPHPDPASAERLGRADRGPAGPDDPRLHEEDLRQDRDRHRRGLRGGDPRRRDRRGPQSGEPPGREVGPAQEGEPDGPLLPRHRAGGGGRRGGVHHQGRRQGGNPRRAGLHPGRRGGSSPTRG